MTYEEQRELIMHGYGLAISTVKGLLEAHVQIGEASKITENEQYKAIKNTYEGVIICLKKQRRNK